MSSSKTSSLPGQCGIRTGAELRRAYLEYFRTGPVARKDAGAPLAAIPHAEVASAPLIPPDDPTLLFTSAGMVQFKNLYSGLIDPLPYSRATTCQKCLRAGGKASDLESVGKTLRHHTFFEMLGNFSFGDYFKREAIRAAWEFCTSPKYMGLPAEHMFPTIYGPTKEKPHIKRDDDAARAWEEETRDLYEKGLVPAPLVNPLTCLDEKENFWGPAGDTGACGACSEIKFFLGSPEELEEARRQAKEDPHTIARRIIDQGDTFLEIWNMVFPEFDQQRDGSRPLLKNKGIDTGAGLERMTVALQWWHQERRVRAPYESDLLWPITQAVSIAVGTPYVRVADSTGSADEAKVRHAINAITDHTRALVFCLAEGMTPSNDGRGYVVRRIQRRALRFARLLGVNEPFMYKLVDAVVDCPSWRDPVTGEHIYPELTKNRDFLKRTVQIEEERFLRTLDQGSKLIDEFIAKAQATPTKTFAGADMFLLHATYGFPPDLTREIAEDAGLKMDEAGYKAAMEQHQEEARKSWKSAALGEESSLLQPVIDKHGTTKFTGYRYDRETDGASDRETVSAILAIVKGGKLVERAEADPDEEVSVVLGATNFYAESGGQIGDTGLIVVAGAGGDGVVAVGDTQKTANGVIIHRGHVTQGAIAVGVAATARPDWERRWAIMRNHSSVHLMQNALRKVVGEHVRQQGSFVGPKVLRFDFTNMEALTAGQLAEIERLVNGSIEADHPVTVDELPLEDARKRGAIAPFGEKYGPTVRVVQMGESIEFCGGTHLRRTGQALRFRILSESSIAAGIRRIEAVAGLSAYPHELDDRRLVTALESRVMAKGDEAIARVEGLQARVKELEKEVTRLRQAGAAAQLDALVASATTLPKGAKLIVGELPGVSAADLKPLAEQALRKAGDSAVVLLATSEGEKVSLLCAASKAAAVAYPANKVVGVVAEKVGGKGGGKPELAQAGGKNPGALAAALAEAPGRIAAL